MSARGVSRLFGVPGPGAWAALILSRLSLSSSVVAVRRPDEDLDELSDALAALAPVMLGSGSALGPAPALFADDARERLASMERLARGARVALASQAALAQPLPSRAEAASKRTVLRLGGSLQRAVILQRLSELGYARADFVESPGEFAVRGAVVDFHPLEPLRPVRLLFNEDRLESIRAFDAETQAAGAMLEEAVLSAAAAPPSGETVFQWLPRPAAWLVEEGVELPSAVPGMVTVGDGEPGEDYGARPVPRFQGNIDLAARRIQEWRGEGLRVLVFCLNAGEQERVEEVLRGRVPKGACQLPVGPLRSGFIHPAKRLAVVSTSELFDRSWRPARAWGRFAVPGAGKVRLRELKPGDFVVHQECGIARYRGLRAVEAPGGGKADCLLLEYRGSDRLYVPMPEFKLVQKFIGAEGKSPRLSSLDRRSWEDVKHRVREGVRELAEQLLRLEAERASKPGFAFPQDSHLEEEFAAAFPFEETQDQRRAIEEVKADMTSPRPMDRLVVGDVGFGKTEVAMRACLKCVAGGKQAAVLAPTTILADQHYRNFTRRFAEYPVRVAMLSRFLSAGEQEEVLELARSGRADIVIGTHRLLSPDTAFKDLGLIVIDEEHRFGVKDKERLRALRLGVDALSLSATPIPRTLYQSLSGLRKISLITSAPVGRQPVSTYVGPWSEEQVREALAPELERGGQAYYVHNKVRTLERKAEELRRLFPGARVGVAHGQLRADALERVMWDFFNGRHDVLVASSIIESGLDIPTVNTLVVEDAQDFGLAQLYQLRGRIGRERRKAYCWLFHPPAGLDEDGRKRLKALKEFSELGSGLQLAMRDLEIRGAGDLLGARQHGFINAVGVEYFCQMLQEEIAQKRDGAPPPAPRAAVSLDLGMEAFIPEDYLPGDNERLDFYKRLLAAPGAEELERLRRELVDLSGPMPVPAENLFRVLGLRVRADAAGVREAAADGERVTVHLRPEAAVPPQSLERWRRDYAGRMEFVRSRDGDGLRVRLNAGEEPLVWLEGFLESLGPS